MNLIKNNHQSKLIVYYHSGVHDEKPGNYFFEQHVAKRIRIGYSM